MVEYGYKNEELEFSKTTLDLDCLCCGNNDFVFYKYDENEELEVSKTILELNCLRCGYNDFVFYKSDKYDENDYWTVDRLNTFAQSLLVGIKQLFLELLPNSNLPQDTIVSSIIDVGIAIIDI